MHDPDPQACPSCGVRPQRLEQVPWGDGRQRLAQAPFVCQSCGALALIDLATGVLLAVPDAAWQVVKERNPRLWQALTQARARLRHAREGLGHC
jgi:hypothetical protein